MLAKMLSSRLPGRFSVHRQVIRDACAVPFALVRSGKVHDCNTLLVSSLRELRATLDEHRTQRNRVDIQHENHVDPPDQSYRVERDAETGTHETRAIPPTHQIPTTPAYPTRGSGAGGGGTISGRNRIRTWGSGPLTRSEMTSSPATKTADGNSWLPTCRWREPAHAMCHIANLARGSSVPLRTPTAARLSSARGRAGGGTPAPSSRCADG